ncbi:MAG TPA: response regulator [Puia sp.]|jgi:DNA-binding NarL/FixJ family response regulator|nr:response regulator [Puia sp.]
MPSPAFIHVALVGDHALNLHALAFLLREQRGFRVVSISRDVTQLRGSLEFAGKEFHPHVVLIDTNFDLHRAGVIISFLGRSHPEIRVAALGLTNDRRAIRCLLQMGLHGYIAKNSDPNKLESMLRRLAAGEGETDAGKADMASMTSVQDRGSVIGQMRGNLAPEGESDAGGLSVQGWPAVTVMERRYFRLTMAEAPEEDIRRSMRLPQSEFGRLVAGIHRQFGVRSSHGLVLALYRNRFIVMDDI